MQEIRASIDIGSNSVILLIAKIKDEKISEVLFEEVNVTSLGKNLDINKKFINETMDNTFKVLASYKKIIKKYNASNLIITATEASRVASNAKQFYDKVYKELGFKVKIITGVKEAELTAKGVIASLDNIKEVSIFDIGGASTELIKVNISPFKIVDSVSLPIGSVRAKELFDKNELDSYLNNIVTGDIIKKYATDYWLGVAGTMTTLAMCFFDINTDNIKYINKKLLTMNEYTTFLNRFNSLTKEEILIKYPFVEKRIDMIKEGSLLSMSLLGKLRCQTLTISTYGLRHGTIVMR